MCVLAFAATAAAQPISGSRDATEELMTFYYKQPQPQRLTNLMRDYEAAAKGWQAYPPIAGFYAVVFRTSPTHIERLIPERIRPSTGEALRASFRLAGTAPPPKVQARLDAVPRDQTLQKEFAGLPAGIDKLVVSTPTHLDLLWGAAFASGDPQYPTTIIRFFAQTADRSDEVAILVLHLAAAISGSTKPIPEALRRKFSQDDLRHMAFAATALWAVVANSKRHKFVDDAVEAYVRANPRKPSAQALAAATNRPMPK